MAMFRLRLWELANLALPMLSMLLVQVALIWAMCLVVFRVMGRDYEAAVMSGGFSGFMLGTTANAVACMEVLSAKYGPAPERFHRRAARGRVADRLYQCDGHQGYGQLFR